MSPPILLGVLAFAAVAGIPFTTALSFHAATLSKKTFTAPTMYKSQHTGTPLLWEEERSDWTMTVADANMFLASATKQTTIPTSSSSSSGPSISLTADLHLSPQDLIHSRRYRDRGILGFTLDSECPESEAEPSTTSSSLHASRSSSGSNVDSPTDWDASSPWQHMGDDNDENGDGTSLAWKSLSSWSSDRPSVFKTNRKLASSSLAMRTNNLSKDDKRSIEEESGLLTSFLPWIPRPSQIQRLSVVELKDALDYRGMPRFGSKSELQQRLLQWSTLEKQKPARVGEGLGLNGPGLSLTNLYRSYGVDGMPKRRSKKTIVGPDQEPTDGSADEESSNKGSLDEFRPSSSSPVADSLAEWSRTVDLEPLFQRREAIHREKQQGKSVKRRDQSKGGNRNKSHDDSSVMSKDQYISVLKKVFDESSSTKYSNYEVKQIYAAAKEADQMGDRALSKRILNELKESTPRDGRIYRRLARMENEEGNVAGAKAILYEGARLDPDNAFLWHGLGQLASSDYEAKKFYRKAIRCNPSLPMPYHAMGTLDHSRGNIAGAMRTLKKGLEYCPTNHRLHHGLGDIYRDAKMLSMAEKCYRNALQHGPEVSHGFAYTALAYVAYDDGSPDRCRGYLRRAVSLNDGRQANAWVSWAQMEEAEGNIDAARTVCMAGIAKYERGLLKHPAIKTKKAQISSLGPNQESSTASEIRHRLMTQVPVYRSGDRFFNVYRNWARLEERHGTTESVEEVYRRAFLAFPTQWKLTIDWAQYYTRLNMPERATELFLMACSQSRGQHGDPYRLHAEYEMSRGNYDKAQKILFRGAVALSQNAGAGFGNRNGMVELYYVWAVCEWHLENLSRSESVFDQALRVTPTGHEGAPARSLIYYAMAKLQQYQEKPILAQHCIGLCLKENAMPGGVMSKVWDLWATVAADMGNERLSSQCEDLAKKAWRQENDDSGSVLSSPRMNMQQMTRRDPWYIHLYGGSDHHLSTSHQTVRLPSDDEDQETEEPLVPQESAL
eukprot:CAMPEP_0172439578 /NCGR_PEP_ID=MMETSP1065-20121228/515_1 /TAXON_ID=265537 /ORGANISM="Amphiprora paludosa, Strain CCMP125" /LENGTH=1006 /DNA_ID=CAMNT_0013188277 /DNA_START=41 /DNA_END=3061 /DNA_ORIENTATION=-